MLDTFCAKLLESMQSVSLLEMFLGILTLVIAAIVAYIAFQQWRLVRAKLKLDLFEKRHDIYHALRELQSQITRSGYPSRDELHQYIIHVRESRWLYNEEMYSYLTKDIYKRGLRLLYLEEQIENQQNNEERHGQLADERHELFQWFTAQYDAMDGMFERYLMLDHE